MNIFRKVFFIIAIVLIGLGCEELTTEAAPAEPAPPPTKTDPAAENPTNPAQTIAITVTILDRTRERGDFGIPKSYKIDWHDVTEATKYAVSMRSNNRDWYTGRTIDFFIDDSEKTIPVYDYGEIYFIITAFKDGKEIARGSAYYHLPNSNN